MHELSIVQGIIDLATQQTADHDAHIVQRIDLEIGELAAIDWNALKFAWKSATPNTVLEHAEYVIIKIPGEAECLSCHTHFHITELYEPCPKCHEYVTEVRKGRELRVKSLIVN